MSAGDFWDPSRYGATARFVTDLGAPVLEMLQPRPGERILDLGCGDGVLTGELAGSGATVVGVDASPRMVEAARERGLDARCHDGTDLPFEAEFDAVFTNAALHWMRPMERAVASAARALRPGGRFVGECGGHGCIAAISVALTAVFQRHGMDALALYPWEFPTPERFTGMLEGNGLEVVELAHFPRPTPIPGTLRDWLEMFVPPLLAGVPPDEADAIVGEVEDLAAPFLRDDEGRWTADYVRLRFRAERR